MLLETMACREIDGVDYILNEPSLECYTDSYNSYTYLLCMPILLIWGLGIPIAMLLSIKYKVSASLKSKKAFKKI